MKLFYQTLTFLCLIMLGGHVASAQDIIVKTDQTEIKAKVLEIEESKIKYKLFDHQDGPTYNIAKKEVFMIIYKSGKRETFGTSNAATAVATAVAKTAETRTKTNKNASVQTVKASDADQAKKSPLYWAVGLTLGISEFTVDGQRTDNPSTPELGTFVGVNRTFYFGDDDKMGLNSDIRASLYRFKVDATWEAKFSSLWIDFTPSFSYKTPVGIGVKAGPFLSLGAMATQKQNETTHNVFQEGGWKRFNAGIAANIGYGISGMDIFLEFRKGLANIEDNDAAHGQKSMLSSFNIGLSTSF